MRTNIRNEKELRELVHSIRQYCVEEDDGFYHFEVTPENFKVLLKSEELSKVAHYMTGEGYDDWVNGRSINGWYGAKITPGWIIKKRDS